LSQTYYVDLVHPRDRHHQTSRTVMYPTGIAKD
jgi:hypothetical protein